MIEEHRDVMMENYQEKYKKELHQQEINSNIHTLKGFFWIFVTILLLWLLTLVRIFIVDSRIFTMAAGVSAVMGIPVLYIYKKVDLSKHWVKYVFLTLICMISAVIAAFLSFHAVLIYVLPLLLAVQYRERMTLWITYVVNDVTMAVSMVTGFYHGICDLNMLLGSNHSRDWYMEQWMAGTLQFGIEPDPVFVILFYGALPRAVILLIFTIILRYISITSHEDAQRIADLTYRKETDLGTHVYNKNKYEEMINDYYPQVDRLAAIFWDVNNLKCVNDKYGHAAGDVLIQTLSSVLYELSTDRRKVYRIGGDEFIVLIKDVTVEELRIMLKAMRKGLKVSLAQKQPEYMFSTSIGIAQFGKDGSDFETLFKIADAALYIAKEKGKDRYIIYDYNKHGDILTDMKHDIAFGSGFMKPMAKYELATNIVMKVSLGKMTVKEVLSELTDKLNIHGISIFCGNDMECIYSTGHYKNNVIEAAYVNDDKFLNHFDEYGVNMVNNIASLTIEFPEVFRKLRDNNICSLLQMKADGADGKEYMVEFDIFGINRRKWSDTDVIMLRMVVLGVVNAVSGQLTD